MTSIEENNQPEPIGRSYFMIGLVITFCILAVDQLSKWWILEVYNLPLKSSVQILPFFSLTMVWNNSISMGLPLDEYLGKWGIIVLTWLISLWLLWWLKDTKRKPEAIALSLILGGAIGNVIDRFVHGAVVDFLHFYAFDYSFYVFNIADSAISIGVVFLIIDGLRTSVKSPKNASKVE
ncbi:signal peptidase II [Kordiimonas sp. SCSIO 12610]|uniref:signal peptidase II n=1 Tax=Kordiimonas sp. SCSIO 12610 TaxID=2829597 RepID=UPI002108708E|nr:signal peptidase II [Kordiimonas sp. SCSIO 12610]UTW54853.1 signal peptidase II [Kordiimonas sp. SCSIO 12610]